MRKKDYSTLNDHIVKLYFKDYINILKPVGMNLKHHLYKDKTLVLVYNS